MQNGRIAQNATLSKIFTAHIACSTLVVEATAAVDAEQQIHKIVISSVNRKRIISINI
jgi:hypothetical protein